MDGFFAYWEAQGWEGFVRIFWFFLILEFPRYVFLDYFFLVFIKTRNFLNRNKFRQYQDAFWEDMPFVSVIIPGKDEGIHYRKIVNTLREQTYQNFEIIIVDDGSSDYSYNLGKKMESRGEIDLFLRNKERGGKASAANFALRYCKGKYVVHFDADCSFDRDAIEKVLIPFYSNEKIGAVSGNLEVRNHEESLVTKFQAIEYMLYISVGRSVSSFLGLLRIVSGAFGAFRLDLLQRLGGWDVGPGLDGDITIKIRKLGYDIHFEPSAMAHTTVPNTFGKLSKQRYRWDRSLIRFRLRKHKDVLFPDHNFSVLNFISILENIVYNLLFNFIWYIYLFDIIFNFSSDLGYILIATFMLYTVSRIFEFLVVLALTENPSKKLHYFIYLPGLVIYVGYYLRFIRTWAYIMEIFFKASYKDAWNPSKTSNAALDLDTPDSEK